MRAAAARVQLPVVVLRDFYVSIVRGPSQRGLLLGPFPTHRAALARVSNVRAYVLTLDAMAGFDQFGTASRARSTHPRPGRLNGHLAHLLEEGPTTC